MTTHAHDDCANVRPEALQMMIQWAGVRSLNGEEVSAKKSALLLGVGSLESGAGIGLNSANISPHGHESRGNKAGDNGESVARLGDVEDYLKGSEPRTGVYVENSKRPLDYQTNFGAFQISPDVLANNDELGERLLGLTRKFGSVTGLFSDCLTGSAYSADDYGLLRGQLDDLQLKAKKIPEWLEIVRKYSSQKPAKGFLFTRGSGDAGNPQGCRKDPACLEASAMLGRWLTYCPKLNFDAANWMLRNKPSYFGTLSKAEPRCQSLIQKSLDALKAPRIVGPDSGDAQTGPTPNHI